MALSRMAAALAASLLAAPAYAFQAAPPQPPTLTAEQAIARQEAALERSLGIGCDREEGEIVVCAPLNRGGIPFPEEEGKRKRLIAGEPPSAAAAMAAGGSCCGPRGGLDVLKMGEVAGKILGKIF